MDHEQLIERFPRVFHVTEAGGWDWIRRHGLLSTSALLNLYGVAEPMRYAIEACRRPEEVVLDDPFLGRAVIRDNRPLRLDILRGCLDGSLADWFRLLNRRVFFWASERRLHNHLRARGHRGQPREVVVADTRRLLARQGDSVSLCAFNSGSALYPNAPHRGPGTFVAVGDYPFEHWRAKRGPSDAVAEVCVEWAVTDVEAVVAWVHAVAPDGSVSAIWAQDAATGCT